MKKRILCLCFVVAGVFLVASGCGNKSDAANAAGDTVKTVASDEAPAVTDEAADSKPQEQPPQETTTPSSYPLGVRALLEAYPASIKGYENGKLIMADGTTLVYDDGKEKSFEVMLDNSSPKDMFYTVYKNDGAEPEYLADAGRSRSEQLFKKMYGSTQQEVGRKLVSVDWFGQKVRVTSVNGMAEQLKKVAAELAKHPELKPYLKSSGAFYWRNVRGAKRLSAHSYGIAFDIGVDKSDYWQWRNPKAGETAKIKYANRIPKKIADIFEKYGFIWGGAWYHYDTMHFEYRPEILRYAELVKK